MHGLGGPTGNQTPKTCFLHSLQGSPGATVWRSRRQESEHGGFLEMLSAEKGRRAPTSSLLSAFSSTSGWASAYWLSGVAPTPLQRPLQQPTPGACAGLAGLAGSASTGVVACVRRAGCPVGWQVSRRSGHPRSLRRKFPQIQTPKHLPDGFTVGTFKFL